MLAIALQTLIAKTNQENFTMAVRTSFKLFWNDKNSFSGLVAAILHFRCQLRPRVCVGSNGKVVPENIGLAVRIAFLSFLQRETNYFRFGVHHHTFAA
jgi:hypothetical protein